LNESQKLPDEVHIAHVHLQVSNLSRALNFYSGVLGLPEVKREKGTAFLSATGQPPYEVILTEIANAVPQSKTQSGLFHVAFRFPSRTALANVLLNLVKHNWPLQGAADHLVSEAIYLPDADGLGIELYQDRPRATWPQNGDSIEMATLPLDLQTLIQQANQQDQEYEIDPRSEIGHVHLQVSDLRQAERFYHTGLGLDIMQRNFPGALFLAAGGYHHHLGVNIWNSRGSGSAAPNAVGLRSYAFQFPSEASWISVQKRLEASGYVIEGTIDHGYAVSAQARDEDGIAVELLVNNTVH